MADLRFTWDPAKAEATIKQLDKVLPASWSRGNPVDVLTRYSGQEFRKAIAANPLDAVEAEILADGSTRYIERVHRSAIARPA